MEEDDCGVAAEGGWLVLVVRHVARGQDVLAGAVRRDTCLCFSYAQLTKYSLNMWSH